MSGDLTELSAEVAPWSRGCRREVPPQGCSNPPNVQLELGSPWP
jgi:hypothetical protein